MNAIDINKRVEQYIQLRDIIKQKEDAFREDIKPYREALEGLNALLLKYLHGINTDSASSPAGTVYRTVKKAATIQDVDAFWNYIQQSQDYDLLDKRANVVAVSDFIQQHGTAPPGVKFSAAHVVGVRRS